MEKNKSKCKNCNLNKLRFIYYDNGNNSFCSPKCREEFQNNTVYIKAI